MIIKIEARHNLLPNMKLFMKTRVYNFKFHMCEYSLDEYLRESIHKSLVDTCCEIIDHTKITVSKNTICFCINPKYDKLYHLITFGNEKVYGSKILNYTFFLNKE